MAHYLLVDGYNVIHANKELAELAADSLDMARRKLCDALCEYKALKQYRIIVVFDAHLVAGGVGSIEKHNNIQIVYTKEAETADHYIERAAYNLAAQKAKKIKITVATSDVLEQLIILGQGASRMSATDLWADINTVKETMRARHINNKPVKKNPISSLVDEETARKLELMRYGDMPNAKPRTTGKHSKKR